jgi:hypothetical protein
MANFWHLLSHLTGKKDLSAILRDLPKEYIVKEHVSYKGHPIAHVVCSPYGIFFLQYKSGKGLISGRPASDYWRRVTGKRVYRFPNPLKISSRAFGPLIKEAGIPLSAIHNLCVFEEKARFEAGTGALVHLSEVKDTLISYQVKILTKAQMNQVLHLLEPETRQRICPRCGAKLVVRHGKNGDFLGCSKYPACRYTENL